MSENKDNKLTLINEKTANDYLTHTSICQALIFFCRGGNIVYVAVCFGGEKHEMTGRRRQNGSHEA